MTTCGARINFNGGIFECENEGADHDGPHLAKILNPVTFLLWDILEGGETWIRISSDILDHIEAIKEITADLTDPEQQLQTRWNLVESILNLAKGDESEEDIPF